MYLPQKILHFFVPNLSFVFIKIIKIIVLTYNIKGDVAERLKALVSQLLPLKGR